MEEKEQLYKRLKLGAIVVIVICAVMLGGIAFTKNTKLTSNENVVNKNTIGVIKGKNTTNGNTTGVAKSENKEKEDNKNNSTINKQEENKVNNIQATISKDNNETTNKTINKNNNTTTNSSNANKTTNKTQINSTTSKAPKPTTKPNNTTTNNNSDMVWVGETGNKYHVQTCSTLKGKGHQITLKQALQEGRQPCKRCH